jgi:SAM-dependent methyltransferase
MQAKGEHVHGEADLVCSYEPRSVLDIGCGTGRVAIELDRRGITTVGVDLDDDLLTFARLKAPQVRWVHADAAELELGERFDVVVLAGNVPNFCHADLRHALPLRAAAHLQPGGTVVAGFALDDLGPSLEDWDRWCADAGLVLADRWGTWDRQPFPDRPRYAVSAHRSVTDS